jgi:hypothetical protein
MSNEKMIVIMNVEGADSGTVHSILNGILDSQEPPDRIAKVMLYIENHETREISFHDLNYMLEQVEYDRGQVCYSCPDNKDHSTEDHNDIIKAKVYICEFGHNILYKPRKLPLGDNANAILCKTHCREQIIEWDKSNDPRVDKILKTCFREADIIDYWNSLEIYEEV